MGKPKIIAIEGTDGSGKGTQVELLKTRLEDIGKRCLVVDFPNYNGIFGYEIGVALKTGAFNSMDPKSIAMWYALDRYDEINKTKKNAFYDYLDYIIFNRSTISNIVYQMARCKEDEMCSVGIGKWIYDLEIGRLSIPSPDITFVLDINDDIYKETIHSKSEREYLGGKDLDANERNTSLINKTMEIYRDIDSIYNSFALDSREYAEKSEQDKYHPCEFYHINCAGNNTMIKSKEEISNLILEIVIGLEIKDKLIKRVPTISVGKYTIDMKRSIKMTESHNFNYNFSLQSSSLSGLLNNNSTIDQDK